jgi:hypothetical protein
MVFCSLFPVDASDFEKLRDSLGKLKLNDSSLHYEMESSQALGLGYRCGFLGLLHMEIIQERLSREFDLDLIPTAPSVVYRVYSNKGEMSEIYNPVDLPDPTFISKIEEPWIKATILVPDEFLGGLLQLCQERRGVQVDLTYQPLSKGDTVVLCSDGLSGQVKKDEIAEMVKKNPDLVGLCSRLIDTANSRGGPDNITAVVARFEGDGLNDPDTSDEVGYQVYPLTEGESTTEPVPIYTGSPAPVSRKSQQRLMLLALAGAALALIAYFLLKK